MSKNDFVCNCSTFQLNEVHEVYKIIIINHKEKVSKTKDSMEINTVLFFIFQCNRRERRRLANHVPERKKILTMVPKEYEKMKKKR